LWRDVLLGQPSGSQKMGMNDLVGRNHGLRIRDGERNKCRDEKKKEGRRRF